VANILPRWLIVTSETNGTRQAEESFRPAAVGIGRGLPRRLRKSFFFVRPKGRRSPPKSGVALRYALHGMRDATRIMRQRLRRGAQLHVDLLIRVVRWRLYPRVGLEPSARAGSRRRFLAAPPGWEILGESQYARRRSGTMRYRESRLVPPTGPAVPRCCFRRC
jgi:hypothetical protein